MTGISVDDVLATTLRHLEAFYTEMNGALVPPLFVDDKRHPRFRYEVHTDTLACFLKGVKLVSTLNAALILYRHAYPQEVGALCRMVEDFTDEIMFTLVPQGDNEVDQTQRQFLENFFQEELDKPAARRLGTIRNGLSEPDALR